MTSTIMEPSEIEQMPRCRFLKPRDGHTARMKGVHDPNPVSVSFEMKTKRIDRHTTVRPATVFDDYDFTAYFDPSHLSRDIPLNKNHLWHDVLEVLEKNAIRKHTHVTDGRYADKQVTDYYLPITGERVFRDILRRPKYPYNPRYVMYRGKKIDTTMIYYNPRRDVLELYGKYKYASADPNIHVIEGKMKLKGNYRALTIQQCLGNALRARYQNGYYNTYGYANDFDHIEVDFGKDVLITHLSTMGRALTMQNFHIHDKSDGYVSGHNHAVLVVNEKDVQCVTKYEVQYRLQSSKKWISAGEFTGNHDRLTENRIQFDDPITARYFRIIPVAYKGSPSMSFVFYTSVPTKEEKDASCPDTVMYTVDTPAKLRYYAKSNKCNGYCCRNSSTCRRNDSRRTQARSDLSVKKFGKDVDADAVADISYSNDD